MEGALMLGLAMFVMAGITVYLVGTMLRSIQQESETKMRIWKNFGLSLGFCLLFLISWLAQGVAQWQKYTDEQREHGEPVEVGDFAGEFSASTLENWQSEFLQLFSFTVMSAVLIHKGSAESKDGTDRVEEALKRIEDHLGTALAREDAKAMNQNSAVHVIPDEAQGWALQEESTYEPAGYYDTQEQAITAGRGLASKKNLTLVIHSDDGTVRDKVGESRG